MERQATQPLKPREAKARLRAAARPGQALAWAWTHPKEGVLAAFILGFFVGTSPPLRDAFASGLVALLRGFRPYGGRRSTVISRRAEERR
jgi:hypothetical protein